MAYFTASPRPTADVCRDHVRSADVMVLIVGFQYGSLVPGDPKKSYTELEYETARELGKPILAFLIEKEGGDLPPGAAIDHNYGVRQEEFRARVLDSGYYVTEVRKTEDLTIALRDALRDLDDEQSTSTWRRSVRSRETPSSALAWMRRNPRISGLTGALLALLLMASCSLIIASSRNSDLPEETGSRPFGASEPIAIKAAIDQLRSCARETLIAPPTCPQRAGTESPGSYASAYGPQEVKWSLNGDPGSGAKVVWNSDHFIVRGNAVMSATFRDSSGENTEVDYFGYDAKIRWVNGMPTVDPREPIARLPQVDESIVKTMAGMDLNSVKATLRDAFAQCFRTNSSQLSARCPDSSSTMTNASDGTWALDGDPALNALYNPDPHTGTVTAVGGFSAQFHGKSIFGGYNEGTGGKYAAIVVNEGGRPRVLSIYRST